MKHRSYNGTIFEAENFNLKDFTIQKPKGISDEQFAADCIEFAGWHAIVIWPDLKSFQGYDCVRPKVLVDSQSIK